MNIPILSADAGPLQKGGKETLLRMSAILDEPDDDASTIDHSYKPQSKPHDREIRVCRNQKYELFASDWNFSSNADDSDADESDDDDSETLLAPPTEIADTSHTSSKFQPLQQVPWEDRIIWDAEEADTDASEETDGEEEPKKVYTRVADQTASVCLLSVRAATSGSINK